MSSGILGIEFAIIMAMVAGFLFIGYIVVMTDEKRSRSIESESAKERLDFLHTAKQAVMDNFPFENEQSKERFDSACTQLESRAPGMSDDECVLQIKDIVHSLDNSHTTLKEKHTDTYYSVNQEIVAVDGEFFLRDDTDELKKILRIGESSAEGFITETAKQIPGGTQEWKMTKVLDQLRYAKNKEQVQLTILDDGEEAPFTLSYQENKPDSERSLVKGKILDETTGYIEINSWSSDVVEQVNKELDAMEQCEAIIFDVRNNSGGNSNLAEKIAGRFTDKKTNYATTVDAQNNKTVQTLEPQLPHIDKQVVLLTSARSLSSNEMFVLSLKDTGSAVSIGDTTGGGSGNPDLIELKLGGKNYNLSVAKWRLNRQNGQAIEGIGIKPDIEAKQSVENSKDVVLQKAIEYIKNS